jgi:hypothetical protein
VSRRYTARRHLAALTVLVIATVRMCHRCTLKPRTVPYTVAAKATTALAGHSGGLHHEPPRPEVGCDQITAWTG